jgi:hypothetical protein
MKKWLIGMLAGMALLQAGMALASKTEAIVKADTKATFDTLVASVQSQMVPGGRFGFMDKKEHEDVNRDLDYMQSLFDKYPSVAQMDANTKLDLFNHQEAVNAILTRRDNNRLVCESIAPVGSHIPRTTCRTYGEIQREHQNTQQVMDNFKHVPQYKGGN